MVSPPRRFCQLALTRVPEGFCTESQPCRRPGPFSGPSRRPCSPGRWSPPWCSPYLPGRSFTELHPLLAFTSSPRPVLQRLPASPSASPARASTDHPGVLGHPASRFRSALTWLRFTSHITWTRAGRARWSGRRKARRRNVSFEGLSSPVVGLPCGKRLSRSWPDLRRLRCGCSRLLGYLLPPRRVAPSRSSSLHLYYARCEANEATVLGLRLFLRDRLGTRRIRGLPPSVRHLPWSSFPFSALRTSSRTQGPAIPAAERHPLSVFLRPSGV